MDVRLRGKQVSVVDMMDARERRQALQTGLLARYGGTMVSFTLNTMGAVKVFPWAVVTFEEGWAQVTKSLERWGIVHGETHRYFTGYEGFCLVDAPLEGVKSAMIALEERHPLGRLFDIDVLDGSGRKMSRSELGFPERTCLLCENPAFVCSRSRTHTVDALLEKTLSMMETYFQSRYPHVVGECALHAMLFEVSVTPKPGLVDRRNNGAHRDMTMETFQQSAHALRPYFAQFTTLGLETDDVATLFKKARILGLAAEDAMLRATGGVNTHKGTIFLMGLLCCALGRCRRQGSAYCPERIQQILRELTRDLWADFQALDKKQNLSHGEGLYVRHGMGGAREEARLGMPHLFDVGLPTFAALLAQGHSENDAGVLTLLHLLGTVADTNLVARSNWETAQRVQAQCRALYPDATMEQLEQLDEEFIAQNLSPGGCADLLALTQFLWQVEGLQGECVSCTTLTK